MNIFLRRFLHNHGNIATEGSRRRGYALLLSNDKVHSIIDSTSHSRPINFEQFGALYIYAQPR